MQKDDIGTSNGKSMWLPRCLWIFLAVLSALDFLNVMAAEVAKRVFGMGEPFNRILLVSPAVDLWAYFHLIPLLHTRQFFLDRTWPFFRYPAPMVFFYAIIFHIPRAYQAFRIGAELTFASLAFPLGRYMQRFGVPLLHSLAFLGVVGVLSYPIRFDLRQANFEPAVTFFVCLGVWAIVKGKDTRAAILIGIAGALKLFPFIFLALFLARKCYRPIIIGALTGALTTIIALRFITPSVIFSWHGIAYGLADYDHEFRQIIPLVIGYDHSIYTLIKAPIFLATGALTTPALMLSAYKVFVAALMVGAYFLRVRMLPFINQVLCLVLAWLFLPPSSYDYTLMNLALPFSLLVVLAVEQRGRFVAGLKPALILLALMMAATQEFILHATMWGAQIKALLFFPAIYIAMTCPWPARFAAPAETPGTNVYSF